MSKRTTVFEHVREKYPALPRLISVGRLDYMSEGLLLLTTDGELAACMELPSNNFVRRYRVKISGKIPGTMAEELKMGVTVDGMKYRPITVAGFSKARTDPAWLTMELLEGKNREIRRVLAHYSVDVQRLIRVGFGPYTIENIVSGDLREVPIADEVAQTFQPLKENAPE